MIDLKGISGWACYQAYLTTIFFLPTTQTYTTLSADNPNMTTADIMEDFKKSDALRKANIIAELISIAPINDAELIALLSVHKDTNGIPYAASNIRTLTVPDIATMVIGSITACSDISTELFF